MGDGMAVISFYMACFVSSLRALTDGRWRLPNGET